MSPLPQVTDQKIDFASYFLQAKCDSTSVMRLCAFQSLNKFVSVQNELTQHHVLSLLLLKVCHLLHSPNRITLVMNKRGDDLLCKVKS